MGKEFGLVLCGYLNLPFGVGHLGMNLLQWTQIYVLSKIPNYWPDGKKLSFQHKQGVVSVTS